MAKVTVKVDPYLCITAANCVGIAPRIFQINEEGLAGVLGRDGTPQGYEHTLDVTAAEQLLIDDAVESCPVRAISIEPVI
jgi:ferredoxin